MINTTVIHDVALYKPGIFVWILSFLWMLVSPEVPASFTSEVRSFMCDNGTCFKTLRQVDLTPSLRFAYKDNLGPLSGNNGICLPSNCTSGTKIVEDFKILRQNSFDAYDVLKHDSSICSVGDVELKSCSKSERIDGVLHFVIQNEYMRFINDYHLRVMFPSMEKTFVCSNPSLENLTQCLGDELFCSINPCTPDDSKRCYCVFNPETQSFQVQVGGSVVTPKIIGSFRVSYTKELHHEDVETCEITGLSCDQDEVNLYFQRPVTAYVKICRDFGCEMRHINSENYLQHKVHHSLNYHDDIVDVSVMCKGSNSTLRTQISCERLNCPACNFCLDHLTSPSCYSIIDFSIILLSLLIACFVFSSVFSVIIIICKMLVCRRLPIRIRTRNWARIHKHTDVEATSTDQLEDFEGVPPRRFNRGYQSAFILCLVFLVHDSNACGFSTSMTSSSTDCSSTEPITCKVKSSIVMNVSPIGQETCLRILSPSGNMISYLKYKTLSVTHQCEEVFQYETFSVRRRVISEVKCYNPVSDRCTKDVCNNWNPNTRLSHSAHNGSFVSSCTLIPGGVEQGCIVPIHSACKFHQVEVEKSDDSYKVFTCPSWHVSVRIQIARVVDGKEEFDVLEFLDGTPVITDGVEYNLESLSSTMITPSASCFMVRNKDKSVSMVDCTKRSTFRTGMIGELQCLDDCTVSTDLMDCISSAEDVKCRSKPLDVSSIHHVNLLPHVESNYAIYSNGNNVYMDVQRSTILTMKASFNDVTFESERDYTLCNAKFIDLTGCYSCESGAKLALSLWTTSKDSIGHLECKGFSFSIPFYANSTKATQFFKLHLNQKMINTECNVTCPMGKTKVKLIGALIRPTFSDFLNSTTIMTVIKTDSAIDQVMSYLNLISNLTMELLHFGLIDFLKVLIMFLACLFVLAKVYNTLQMKLKRE